MRLRGTQAKLDTFRIIYQESLDKCHLMNRNFEEASGQLKEMLASTVRDNLNLKKQIASGLAL